LNLFAITFTKPDKVNHGFGLTRMKAIASKYDGTVNLSYNAETKKFTLEVIIKTEPY